MPIVLDCSAVLGIALSGESADHADRVLRAVVREGGVVPPLFWYELRNALLMAERRGRLPLGQAEAFLQDLGALPIVVDHAHAEHVVLQLARRFALTVYDAAYLEVAMRLGAPLATLDGALRDAVRRAGGVVFEG
jgi:predicted nucleic acid-binding protein